MNPGEVIRYVSEPKLRAPIMVAAFRGWNDAGEAATFAASHLARLWSAQPLASIDPEDFYDFQAVRPQVQLVDGVTRRVTWPANEFSTAELPGGDQDVILLVGTEPNTRWRAFTETVVGLARKHEVQLVITLGALLADVPHSRPVQITGTAMDPKVIERLNLYRSRYEGPTGIVGVLHDAFASAGVASASLWAAVPHYLSVSPNPKGALALVNKAAELIGASVDVGDLERATAKYEERIGEMVAADDDIQTYVRLLEEKSDERESDAELGTEELPSGEALAAELERFLRGQGDPPPSSN